MIEENEDIIDSIEFRTTFGVKIFLILFSPIIAPIWLFRKFRYKSSTLKLEIKYKK